VLCKVLHNEKLKAPVTMEEGAHPWTAGRCYEPLLSMHNDDDDEVHPDRPTVNYITVPSGQNVSYLFTSRPD